MIFSIKSNHLNPNPISKFLAVILLGMTGIHSINHYLEWAAVLVISTMYFINGFKKDGVRNILVFGFLFLCVECFIFRIRQENI